MYDFHRVVLTMSWPKTNIKGDMRDFVNFPYLGNNFLMRYPDDFGHESKLVDLDPMHTISKAQVSRADSFWDIRSQSFYLIRAYHKKYWSDPLQKVICPELLMRSIILTSFSFLSRAVFELCCANGNCLRRIRIIRILGITIEFTL